MVKIFIDPGHGGSDPGAVGNGMQEKNLTLSIATQIRDMLVSEYENAEVRMSRTGDTAVSLTERSKMANDWGADYFLSVHINAGGGTGFESFIHTTQTSGSVKAQNVIHPAIMQQIGGTDRGKKNANFAVLRTSKMPAILTEVLFIDNANDAAKLKDPAFLTRAARGHVDGLAKAFGLKRKSGASKPDANKPEASNPTPKKKYPLPNIILKHGSKGIAVRQLQTALNAANFKVGKVDGDFGKLTEDAVRRFQKVYLPREVDGIYGPNTRRELDKAVN